MDLNNPVITPNARQIVGRFLLNGVEVPFVSFEVDSNSFYSADTFSAELAISALPKSMGLLNWWANQTSIEVQISVGILSKQTADWETLIIGGVDRWSFNPARYTVSVEGRDYTAKLIDVKTSEKFANYKASDIAIELAKRHGLRPVVVPTKTLAGTIYKIDHVQMNDERSEWDLLSYLAGVEGYQVYVKGNDLHFEPATKPTPKDINQLKSQLDDVNKKLNQASSKSMALNNQATDLVTQSEKARAAGNKAQADSLLNQAAALNQQAGKIQADAHADCDGTKIALEKQIAAGMNYDGTYVIRWVPPNQSHPAQANCSEDLKFERDLTLAKGVTVQVRSWTKGKAFTVAYPQNTAKGITPGKATAKRQVYSIVRSGLTRDDAMKLAQQTHKQITDHEMRMSCSLPGDNILMPSTIVRVEGTASPFDQLYFVDSVRRSFSFDGGYSMSLTAKNHNPNSMILP
ncbi:hypothetical protein ACUXVY_12940 [Chromobacterium haemolyticum]|uniref:hypothetical protein n=1 Tax=Chromobacterium haemolyticum TaxID=394935 RepID=UPI004056BC18